MNVFDEVARRDDSLRPGIDDRLATPVHTQKTRRQVPHGLGRLLGPVLLVALWFVATGLGWVDTRTLASPQAVLDAAQRLTEAGQLQDYLLISLKRAMKQWSLSVVIVSPLRCW